MIRIAFLLSCLTALSADASDLCGATIVDHLKLDHDLLCAGTGLIAGADNLKIDLNGFTIVGVGTGAGIDVTGRTKVTIVGGTIRNFFAGVLTLDSSQIVVAHMALVENTDGIDLNQRSTGNTVKHCEFRGNRSRGIMIRGNSSLHVVMDNTFIGDRVGILLFGSVDSLVQHNVVMATQMAGIRLNVIATGNMVVHNTLLSNPVGIDFILTTMGTADGNTVSKNTVGLNVCGIKGNAAGNTLEKNLFEANGADTCP